MEINKKEEELKLLYSFLISTKKENLFPSFLKLFYNYLFIGQFELARATLQNIYQIDSSNSEVIVKLLKNIIEKKELTNKWF